MTTTIAIANNKGGVGKSAFTVHTAAALARAGHRVLIIDLDPQANATRRLGIEWTEGAAPLTLIEAFSSIDPAATAQAAVLPSGWSTSEAERLFVIPARYDLINRESEAGQVGAVRRLQKALSGSWTQAYDFVLIDTPPSLGHLTQMALAAADGVIIPTEAGYDGVEAAIRVRDFITEHAADLANPGLALLGIVVTRYRATAEKQYQLSSLTELLGAQVWDLASDTTPSAIPEWSRFDEADAAAVSLTAWSDARARQTVAIYDRVATLLSESIRTQTKPSMEASRNAS